MAIESPLTQTSSISSKSSNNEKTLYEINKEEKEVALKLNKLTEKASLNKNDIHLYHDNKNIFPRTLPEAFPQFATNNRQRLFFISGKQ